MLDLPYPREAAVVSLLASPVHRYEGRPADGPREPTTRELFDSIEVRAGLGIVGDRFFGKAAHRTASVTIQSIESLEAIERELGLSRPLDPADTRRNIIVRDIPIDDMRGEVFSLDTGDGPVLFRAHRPANPCAWMDVTLAPGAHKAMRGRGGMRCEPLSSGTLALGPVLLRTAQPIAAVALF